MNRLQSLDEYMVCIDAGSYEALGRRYLLNDTRMPVDALAFADLEAVGRQYEDKHPGLFIGSYYVQYPDAFPEQVWMARWSIMAEALYPYSREEAKREGELERWRESHRANISCARNLSGLIDTHARQGQLEPDTAQFALKQWGVLRVQFVLSNTLCGASTQEFDPDALHWARTACVPPDKTNGEFKIRADSTLLAQFMELLAAWKDRQPPERTAPEKKTDREK